MKTFLKHLVIDYKINIRDRSLLLMSYLFPLVFFSFMGFVMTSINPPFKEILFQSMLIFTVLVCTILIIPNVIVDNRENGIYRSYKIYGVNKLSLYLLVVISNFINVVVVSIIITVLSKFLFNVTMPNSLKGYLVLYLSVFLVWIVTVNLSLLLGNLIKNTKHTVLYTQIFFLPSMLLGGLMIPVSQLGEGMRYFALIIPTSHGLNIIDQWVYLKQGVVDSIISLCILVVSGIILFILSIFTFRYDNKQN